MGNLEKTLNKSNNKKFFDFKLMLLVVFFVAFFCTLLFTTIKLQKEKEVTFERSGYLLENNQNSGDVDKVERYYFNEGTSYKNGFNNTIVFKDVNGDKVTVSTDKILHFQDKSISTLGKGVLIDLEKIDQQPLVYYNIFPNSTLQKTNTGYEVYSTTNKLKFNKFILKISSNKYMIVGENMQMNLGGETVNVEDYIEFEFVDGGIIKLYNQDSVYRSISSTATISIEDITLDLSSKAVSKNNEVRFTLADMVIDSDDNIEILPSVEEENITEEKPEDNKEENNSNNQNNGNSQNNGSNDNNNMTNNGTINGSTGGGIIVDDNEVEQEEEDVLPATPKINITDMKVTSIKADVNMELVDDDRTINSTLVSKIIENSTGKVVYMQEDSADVFGITISVESLTPNTEYTLITTATYVIDNIEYQKDFVSKVFRTEEIGIDFEKDYFTDNQLNFIVTIDNSSLVKNGELVLLDSNGETIATKPIDGNVASNGGQSISFNDLKSNTKYKVKLINILYDGAVLANGFQIEKEFTTLKVSPTLGTNSVYVDKKNSSFTLNHEGISDTDHGIKSYRFEIYDARTIGEDSEPVKVINQTKSGSVDVKIDNEFIVRGIPYVFKYIVEFNDNEKIVEYESPLSNVFSMDGVAFPTVRFVEKEVTFEKIEGTIVIDDKESTVDLSKDNRITVQYTDSTGESDFFTTNGTLNIPFSVNNLRANETYNIAVYANINLQDGNPVIENCYIGSVIVQTEPTKPFLGILNADNEDTNYTFKATVQLGAEEGVDNELEANTLSGLTFNLYAGQTVSGTPVKSMKLIDSNSEPYESMLKETFYDKEAVITPEFFGAKNSDFSDEYYTLQITQAYDYTKYKNIIPIENNTITFKTNGYVPELPENPDEAMSVSVIRNRDDQEKYRTDLNPETIIGFRVKPIYDNAKLYAKYIKYYVYDADTNELIESATRTVDVLETGEIEAQTFYLGDGTANDVTDTELRRGHNYYFAYEAYLDLNDDGQAETKYPYEDSDGNEVVLKSPVVSAPKQQANIKMYPSTSSGNSITMKYSINDVDNSLVDKVFTAKINNVVKSNKTLDITDNYKEVVFDNLSKGTLLITTQQQLLKNKNAETRNLISHYFEGVVTLSNLQYHVDLEVNRVVISLLDYESKKDLMNRIAALKVTFSSEEKTIVKEYLPLDSDRVVIELFEIEELLQSNVTISVQAYYDTGITGFDTNSTASALQLVSSGNAPGSYLSMIEDNSWKESSSAANSIFTKEMNDTELNLTSLIDSVKGTINYSIDEYGFRDSDNYYLLKKLDTYELNSDGTNNIRFDYIIPGVSLMDESDQLRITPTLFSAKVKMDFYFPNFTTVKDNKVYLELYQTDETATTSELVQTLDMEITSGTLEYNIKDLIPGTNYYFKLFVYLEDGGTYKKHQLYDIDYQSANKQYYFQTLKEVGISNVSVNYRAVSYDEKYLDVKYDLAQIAGYDKIEYKLYSVSYSEDGTQIKTPVDIDITDDTVFSKNMTKSIPCPPGSAIEFGKNYIIEITPISTVEIDGKPEILELGKVESPFHLATLVQPFAAIVSNATDDISIEFRVSISDLSKVVVGEKFKVKLLDQTGLDVTPSKYRDVEYSTKTLNQKFSFENLQRASEYTFVVMMDVDIKNNGSDIEKMEKSLKAYTIDDSGIDLGQVSTVVNANDRNKIQLVYYGSYKLTDIEKIRYSIYDVNGYAQSNEVDFTPTQNGTGFDASYTFTLPESLPSPGVYYVEIQYILNGRVIKSSSIEHTYTK